jgi:hypothetical protein
MGAVGGAVSGDGSEAGVGSTAGDGSTAGVGSTDGVGSTIGAGAPETSGWAAVAPLTLDRSTTVAVKAARLRRITGLRRGSIHEPTQRTSSCPNGATTCSASSEDAA